MSKSLIPPDAVYSTLSLDFNDRALTFLAAFSELQWIVQKRQTSAEKPQKVAF